MLLLLLIKEPDTLSLDAPVLDILDENVVAALGKYLQYQLV